MKVTAKDLMTTPSAMLTPELYLPKAFEAFQKAFALEGEVFGLMVVDEKEHLVGVLSMYDIFLLFLPKNIQIWWAMEEIDLEVLTDKLYQKVKSVKVADVMTENPVSITPETPLLPILDIIVKKQIRRIPVVEGDTIVGLVYACNVFYHLIDQVSR